MNSDDSSHSRVARTVTTVAPRTNYTPLLTLHSTTHPLQDLSLSTHPPKGDHYVSPVGKSTHSPTQVEHPFDNQNIKILLGGNNPTPKKCKHAILPFVVNSRKLTDRPPPKPNDERWNNYFNQASLSPWDASPKS